MWTNSKSHWWWKIWNIRVVTWERKICLLENTKADLTVLRKCVRALRSAVFAHYFWFTLSSRTILWRHDHFGGKAKQPNDDDSSSINLRWELKLDKTQVKCFEFQVDRLESVSRTNKVDCQYIFFSGFHFSHLSICGGLLLIQNYLNDINISRLGAHNIWASVSWCTIFNIGLQVQKPKETKKLETIWNNTHTHSRFASHCR